MTDPSPLPQARPPITVGGVMLIILGGLLLIFPGGCSLFVAVATLIDMATRRGGGGLNIGGLVFVVSTIGLLVACFGFWLIRVGLRRRQTRSVG